MRFTRHTDLASQVTSCWQLGVLPVHESPCGVFVYTGDILAAQYEASEKADAELSAVQKRVQARASYMGVVGKVSRRLPPKYRQLRVLPIVPEALHCSMYIAHRWIDGQPLSHVSCAKCQWCCARIRWERGLGCVLQSTMSHSQEKHNGQKQSCAEQETFIQTYRNLRAIGWQIPGSRIVCTYAAQTGVLRSAHSTELAVTGACVVSSHVKCLPSAEWQG